MEPVNVFDICLQCLLHPQHQDELIEITRRVSHDPSSLTVNRAGTELALTNILRRHGIDPRSVFLRHTPEEILGRASYLLRQNKLI